MCICMQVHVSVMKTDIYETEHMVVFTCRPMCWVAKDQTMAALLMTEADLEATVRVNREVKGLGNI